MQNNNITVVKNASSLLVSQLLTWVLTLTLTIVLSRYLGATLVGEYTIASSIWTVIGVFINFGMDTLLVKDIARTPEKSAELLSTTITARIILFVISYTFTILYAHIFHLSSTTLALLTLLGIAQLITQLYLAIQSSLQGLELMHHVSVANVLSRVINTSLGIIAIFLGYSIYGISVVTIIAMTAGLLLQYISLRQHHPIFISARLGKTWQMLRAGLPYLASSLGLVAYNQVDVLVISSLINSTQVGWYSSASRLFGTMMFFPVIFTTALFPTMTRSFKSSPDSLPKMMQKSFNMMLVLSTPLGLGLLIIAKPLVELLYGTDFAPSSPILAVMGLVLIPTYQNILIGQFLTSIDRQNRWTFVMLGATAATLPLDIVLVPWCQTMFGNGAIAGALSFLITEIAMVIIGIKFLPSGSLNRNNVTTAFRVFFAGGCMVFITGFFNEFFILIPIVLGALVYTLVILGTKVIPQEDIILFRGLTTGLFNRLRKDHKSPIHVEG